jgi:hypothetical protein
MASHRKAADEHTEDALVPHRQIRAVYDSETITVYQAYSSAIAIPAVTQQRLNASPDFSMSRMTWIKPSWAWMLYRSGYSYKDSRQTHILALRVRHSTFLSLLRGASLSHNGNTPKIKSGGKTKSAGVVVQWDPERTVRLEKLPYRSIQIGIPGALVPKLIDGIVHIEDVSQRARELKGLLEAENDDAKEGHMGLEHLVERGLVPVEREYAVDEDIRAILGI